MLNISVQRARMQKNKTHEAEQKNVPKKLVMKVEEKQLGIVSQ